MEIKDHNFPQVLSYEELEEMVFKDRDISLDYSWIFGDTCSRIFDPLTVQERWLLFTYYSVGPDICKELDIHTSTLYRMFDVMKGKMNAR